MAVTTADVGRPQARRCLAPLKRYAAAADLWILDGNTPPCPGHGQQLNAVLRTADTDFVVFLTDNVLVTPGWLEGLLDAAGPGIGLVTPVERNRWRSAVRSGVYWSGDGGADNFTDVPSAPRACPLPNPAAILVDRKNCAASSRRGLVRRIRRFRLRPARVGDG